MNIDFVWSTPTTTVQRDVLESKIRDDIENDRMGHPCHSGKITVHFLGTDGLEVTIKGKVVCQCGKAFMTFSSNDDGSSINLEAGDLLGRIAEQPSREGR